MSTRIMRDPASLDGAVRLGVYEHSKGGRYTLIAVGYSTNNADDQPYAVYTDKYGVVNIRALAEFLGWYDRPFGKTGPRFVPRDGDDNESSPDDQDSGHATDAAAGRSLDQDWNVGLGLDR